MLRGFYAIPTLNGHQNNSTNTMMTQQYMSTKVLYKYSVHGNSTMSMQSCTIAPNVSDSPQIRIRYNPYLYLRTHISRPDIDKGHESYIFSKDSA